MKNELKEKGYTLEVPQVLLEKVLTAEIEIAHRVSDAREQAEKEILEAQSNTTKLKNKIIENARAERDQVFIDGVEAARMRAEKSIEEAKKNAEKFLQGNQKFIDEADDQIMDFLLGLESESK